MVFNLFPVFVFYFCAINSSIFALNYSLALKLGGINKEPLSDSQVLFYNINDTDCFSKNTQYTMLSNTLFSHVLLGNYHIKMPIVDIKQESIQSTIDTFNIDSVPNKLEHHEILEEVTITENYPEKEILFKGSNPSRFKTKWASNDPQSYTHTFQNVDASDGKLGKYVGTWQWRSADGDTILTVELLDVSIRHIMTIDSDKDAQDALPLGAIRSSNNTLYSRKSYAPKTIRYCKDRLFGKFEYQIGDSILFTNLHSKIRFSKNFLRKRRKSKEERGALIGLPDQTDSNHAVSLYWPRNPLGENEAVVTLSFLDEKKSVAIWRMDVLKEIRSDRFITRKASKEDFVLPVSVVMQSVEKGKHAMPAMKDTINHAEVILRDTLDNNQLDEVTVTAKYPERNIGRWFRKYNSLHESSPRKGELTVYRDEVDENLSRYEGVWQWRSADGDTILTVKLIDGLLRIPLKIVGYDKRLKTDRQAQYHVNRLFGKYEYQIGDSILYSNLDVKQVFNYSYFMKERKKKGAQKENFLVGVDVQPCSDTYVLLRMRRHKPFIKEHGIITFSLLDEKKGIALWRMELIIDSTESNFKVRKAFKADTVYPTSVVMHRIDS